MAETSEISWTDATVNFWWGCTKVGPGCDHCYAETWAARTGLAWGVGTARREIKGAHKLLHKLDNGYSEWSADYWACEGNAKVLGLSAPAFAPWRRVFIQSMSDLFDLEVEIDWFARAWQTIYLCNCVAIQIVTKRITAVEKRLAAAGVGATDWPQHAGLMITVTNQDEADRDIPRLIALKNRLGIPWIGLSIEPILGRIDLTPWLADLDVVICGGESGAHARPMHPDWARSIRDQCIAAGVPFHFKQWGEYLPVGQSLPGYGKVCGATAVKPGRMKLHYYGGTPKQAPKHAFAERGVECALTDDGRFTFRVGKKAAGRLLDGAEYNGMPKAFGAAYG